MNQFKAFLNEVGLEAAPLFAGLFGAVTTVYRSDRKLTMREIIGLLIVGMFTAGYLTPIIAKWLNISAPMQNALSFLVGMIGMQVVGGVLKVGRKFEKDPEKTIRNFKTGGLTDDEDDDKDAQERLD